MTQMESRTTMQPDLRKSAAPPIRPFRYEASDAELADLRRRIEAARWPEKETDFPAPANHSGRST